MTWSMGEIRSLAQKAAKGAGMPWGLAEEAGFAVEWLERRNAPGVVAMVRLLEETDPLEGYRSSSCPIGNGSWISDTGSLIGNFPMTIEQPLLIVPFIANTLKERVISINWLENTLIIAADEMKVLKGERLTAVGHHLCDTVLEKYQPVISEPADRIPDDRKPFIEAMELFAARTYAPATEQSRLSGAGAGTSDND